MHRRDLLRCAAAGLPFVPHGADAALAFGREAHAAARVARFRALSPHQAGLITAIGDQILPRTDTPSASDVGVPAFIDHLLAEWYETRDAQLIRQGLDDIDRLAGGSLADLDAARREQVAARLDASGGGDPGTAAWAWMRIKSLTVYGYFTSERIATEVLRDPVIPGEFRGCEPMHR